jgi:hypothetical protein
VRPKPVTSHASLIVQASRWPNGIVFDSSDFGMDEVTRECSLPFPPRRLYLKTSSYSRKTRRARVSRATIRVNASTGGPSRTVAPRGGRSKASGHQRRQENFFRLRQPQKASRQGRTSIVDLLRSEANLLEGPLPSEGKGHSFRYDPFRKFGSRYMPKTRATRAAIATKPDLERRKGMSSGCRPPLHDHARRTFCISAVSSGA